MIGRLSVLAVLLSLPSASATSFSGKALDPEGRPVPGAFVTAADTARGIRISGCTSADGTFELEAPDAWGPWLLTAHRFGYGGAELPPPGNGVEVRLSQEEDRARSAPSYAYLGLLPEGDEKRRFIVDCMGCHSLNGTVMWSKEGKFLDEAGWKAGVDKMLSFAGHKTMFPILPPDRTSGPTAAFVAKYLTEASVEKAAADVNAIAPGVAYTVTEYDMPDARDFAHDLRLDGTGGVLVTGMFSGMIYRLDPATGGFTTRQIPIPMANPRALDVDAEGDWWVLCGFPKSVARYTPSADKWQTYNVGMYGHSIMADASRRVWFNGHFTNDPILMGYVDAGADSVHTLEVPPTGTPAEQGGPIPYGLRVGPDGTVWSTELAGNRLVRHSPGTGETRVYTMPSPHSGPRRLDVAGDGGVWIPEFSAGRIARFDPGDESFSEYDFPTPNSLPYCARIDHARGRVWVSQCGSNSIARVDMETKEIVEFPLPVDIAFIRHLDVDQDTGDVWATYSHSPNQHPRVVRLSLR
jgi:virginiamycin B lyase